MTLYSKFLLFSLGISMRPKSSYLELSVHISCDGAALTRRHASTLLSVKPLCFSWSFFFNHLFCLRHSNTLKLSLAYSSREIPQNTVNGAWTWCDFVTKWVINKLSRIHISTSFWRAWVRTWWVRSRVAGEHGALWLATHLRWRRKWAGERDAR